jgi:glycosyltransferase involved in cell wall biosynthesis
MSAPRTVLQIGDVAGVAANLRRAIDMSGTWKSEQLQVPEHAAGRHLLLKATMLAPRAVELAWRADRTTARLHPDVVHLHWARYATLVGSKRRPLVVHAHGSDVRGRAATWSGRVVGRALRRAALVVASTPDLLADLPPGARYLPSPIDTDLFAPTQPCAPADQRPPVVFAFARLTAIKGADDILDAVRELRRRRPDVLVRGVSGGTHDAAARALGMHLAGPLDRAGVLAQLRSADVVIGQQRLGSLGLSELEAMACGRPVVARLSAGLFPDQLPVAASPDPHAIVQQCMRLLDHPEDAHRLGTQARRYVVAQHGLEVIGARVVNMYEDLL